MQETFERVPSATAESYRQLRYGAPAGVGTRKNYDRRTRGGESLRCNGRDIL